MQNITIDNEFKNLIAPLSPAEYSLLEQSIIDEGCHDAIVLWTGTEILLDGHNRVEICDRHRLPCDRRYKSFDNRADAMIWIYENQLGRRNLTDEYRTYLLGARYELEIEVIKQRSPEGQFEPHDGKASQRLAENTDESESTIKRAAKYKRAIDLMAGHDDNVKDSILLSELKVPKCDVMQYGAVCRDNPELGKLAVDELLSGNTSSFKHSIYNGTRQQKQTTKATSKSAADQRNEEERMHMTESEKELARLAHKAACDVLMAYIPATVYHKIEEAGLLQQALRDAIAEWKSQQAKKVGNNE